MEVEWLVLADAAQVVGGKLYLMGGGWENLTVNTPLPVRQHCAVAAAFSVPWDETNRKQNVEVEIQTEDGSILMKVAGQIEAGRPPGIPSGQPQRVQLAVELDMELASFGTYVIVARTEGEEGKRVRFNVMPGPLMALQQPRSQGAA